jgi:hypothetical protein
MQLRKISAWLPRVAAAIYSLGFGYYWYLTESPPSRPVDFVWGLTLAAPFSIGLIASTIPIGRRFWKATFALTFISSLVHLLFPAELRWLIFIDLLVLVRFVSFKFNSTRKPNERPFQA